MKAGEIYWVNLDPTIGDETQKRRPVVVLNGGHDKHLKLAIVVPVTAWSSYWVKNPFFVSLDPNINSGLKKKSVVDPNVAKAGGLQSQGVKGEVVAVYRDPFTTQDLKSSGFPAG